MFPAFQPWTRNCSNCRLSCWTSYPIQALVAQEPVLFNTSVRQNLLYGLPQCRIDSDPKDPGTWGTGCNRGQRDLKGHQLLQGSQVNGVFRLFCGASSHCHFHVHPLGKCDRWPCRISRSRWLQLQRLPVHMCLGWDMLRQVFWLWLARFSIQRSVTAQQMH